MSKSKLATMVLGVLGIVLAMGLGAVWVEVRELGARMAGVEEGLASARAVREVRTAPGSETGGTRPFATRGNGSPPGDPGEDLAALRADVMRLNEQVAGLQGRLDEQAKRADDWAARVSAQEAGEGSDGATSAAMIRTHAQAVEIRLPGSGSRAIHEMELDRIADEVGLTEAQKDRGRQILRELIERHLDPPLNSTGGFVGGHEEFLRQWQEQLRGLMTSEQQVAYDSYQERKRQEHARTAAHFSASTLDQAVALLPAQRERITTILREHYGRPGASSDEAARDAMKDAIRRELAPDQMSGFDEWAERNLRIGAMGGNAVFIQSFEIRGEKK